jgi:hypothetical protein
VVIATHLDDRTVVSGDARQARVLTLSVFCEQPFSKCYEQTASPPARSAIVLAREAVRGLLNRSSAVTDTGQATLDFLREMLAHARAERPAPLAALPAGVTDLRLFRVWIDGGVNNVVVQGRPAR